MNCQVFTSTLNPLRLTFGDSHCYRHDIQALCKATYSLCALAISSIVGVCSTLISHIESCILKLTQVEVCVLTLTHTEGNLDTVKLNLDSCVCVPSLQDIGPVSPEADQSEQVSAREGGGGNVLADGGRPQVPSRPQHTAQVSITSSLGNTFLRQKPLSTTLYSSNGTLYYGHQWGRRKCPFLVSAYT